MRELADWLLGRDNFLLFCHVAPDGDTIGSSLAIALALREKGKRCCVKVPGGVPQYLRFLPGMELVAEGEAPFAARCGLAVDVSTPGMLGENREIFESLAERAVLDHHDSNAGYGQVFVIEPRRAATGEMALELIEALGVPVNRDMANCLYTAISSDTGNFNFSNVTPETFVSAAKLVTAGADVDGITRRLYRTRTFARTKLLGLALSDARLVMDGRVACARVTRDMFRQAGAVRSDTEQIVNYLGEIQGVEIAILGIEVEDGTVKFSLRSSEGYDVAKLAQSLGGGGHERAAGVSLSLLLDQAMKTVLEAVGGIL